MKVTSNSDWHEVMSALKQDTSPQAQQLITFITTWAELAESFMKVFAQVEGVPPLSPADALRRSLGECVTQMHTNISTLQIGWALIVLTHVWEPIASDRDGFVASLTSIEQNLYREMAQLWIAERQRLAEQGRLPDGI